MLVRFECKRMKTLESSREGADPRRSGTQPSADSFVSTCCDAGRGKMETRRFYIRYPFIVVANCLAAPCVVVGAGVVGVAGRFFPAPSNGVRADTPSRAGSVKRSSQCQCQSSVY